MKENRKHPKRTSKKLPAKSNTTCKRNRNFTTTQKTTQQLHSVKNCANCTAQRAHRRRYVRAENSIEKRKRNVYE